MNIVSVIINNENDHRKLVDCVNSLKEQSDKICVFQKYAYSTKISDKSIVYLKDWDEMLSVAKDFDFISIVPVKTYPPTYNQVFLQDPLPENCVRCLYGFKTMKENDGRAVLLNRMPGAQRGIYVFDSGDVFVDGIYDFPVFLSRKTLDLFHGLNGFELAEFSSRAKAENLQVICVDPSEDWFPLPRTGYRNIISIHEEIPTTSRTSPSGTSEEIPLVYGKPCNAIVSLTTIPSRIRSFCEVVGSLLNQTAKPKEIRVYMSEKNFPDKALPATITSFLEENQTVSVCWEKEDLRSFKKLLPIMRNDTEYDVITADDDLVYKPDFVEKLVACHEKYEDVIIGNYYNLMCKRRGSFHHGRGIYFNAIESAYIKPGTGAGMYFPKGIFEKTDFGRKDLFMTMMPTHDELWVWLQAYVNRIPIRCSGDYTDWKNMGWSKEINNKQCLSSENVKVIHEYMRLIDRYLNVLDVNEPMDDPLNGSSVLNSEKIYV